MANRCTWCQKEDDRLPDLSFAQGEAVHYVCPDCLISFLPTDLNKGRDPHPTEQSQEQRASAREVLLSQIFLSFESKKSGVSQAIILDMSAAGMKLQIEQTMAKGAKITLGLFGRDLVCKYKGDIVYVKPVKDTSSPRFEIGLKFTDIHQEAREVVRDP